MIRSEHMTSCLAAQIGFMLFKGPGSFKQFFKIGGNVEYLKTYRLIPLIPLPPLSFYSTFNTVPTHFSSKNFYALPSHLFLDMHSVCNSMPGFCQFWHFIYNIYKKQELHQKPRDLLVQKNHANALNWVRKHKVFKIQRENRGKIFRFHISAGNIYNLVYKYKLQLKVFDIVCYKSLKLCENLFKKATVILRIWMTLITRGHRDLIFWFFSFSHSP